MRSSLVYVPPEICANLVSTTPPRFILAVHGYGGIPMQEIHKWHFSAISLRSIVIAPKGTLTSSNGRLGWNAIDCCGDPVTNDVDDLDFLVHGVIAGSRNEPPRKANRNRTDWRISVQLDTV